MNINNYYVKAKVHNWKELPKDKWWIEGLLIRIPGLDLLEGKQPDALGIQTSDNSYKIDPETICRYTGRTDKNGTKMWENDVVKKKFIDGDERLYIIKWFDNDAKFVAVHTHLIDDFIKGLRNFEDIFKNYDESKYEVIGSHLDANIPDTRLLTLNPGDTFKVGEYDFIVLEQKQGTTVVISKDFMAKDKIFDNSTRDYNKSSLKKLIEDDIQPIIENEVGADNLIEHNIDLTSVDMQNEFGTCRCKVRPVTFDEARKYNDLLVNEELNDVSWTCTPWSTKERGWKCSIATVSSSGGISSNIYEYNGGGVRPVCVLNSDIFVLKTS